MPRPAAKKKKPLADATDVTPFRLDNHVFYLFGQIFGHRNRLLNRELRQFSIDYPRWRVLGALNEHPGCSMQKLADKTAVDRTTLAHTVRIMVDEKLVHRHARADATGFSLAHADSADGSRYQRPLSCRLQQRRCPEFAHAAATDDRQYQRVRRIMA
jgi:hypothetical protein